MKTIKRVIKQQQQKVFPMNQKNYLKVCGSYLQEIRKYPERYNFLTRRLSERILQFQSFDKSFLPPLLCKRIGESNNEYLNRCYKKGNYSCQI